MLVGADVSAAGGLPTAIGRGDAMRADVIQIRALSSRQWHGPRPTPEVLTTYREMQQASHVTATYCHAPYLINLATADNELAKKSYENLVDNLVVATGLGSAGVVLHVGSHLGRGTEVVLEHLGGTVVAALDEASDLAGEPSCPLMLENTAGGGGTIGRSFVELAAIIDAAGGDDRLGICLDTQHLFASGVDYSTVETATETIDAFDAAIGLSRLGCMHLNDSKVEFGSNRDRHENLGEGLIGRQALGLFCGHPALANTAMILEVPGDGSGPRKSDVTAARRMISTGKRRWQ